MVPLEFWTFWRHFLWSIRVQIMENWCQFVFTITLTVGIHFSLNFSESRALEQKKTELPRHHVISTVCTIIEHSYLSISAREIARLLKKKKSKKIFRPASFPGSLCFPSLQERGRRESGKEVVFGDLTNVYQQSAIMKGCVNMKVNIVICWE